MSHATCRNSLISNTFANLFRALLHRHLLSNPFDVETVESDVIVLRTGIRTALAPTGVSRRQLSSSSSLSTKGNVTIEFYSRDHNTSTADAPDECGAVFNVNASGFIGLETALEGACATWNASALQFEPNQGCNLTNASMSDVDGRWSLQCSCAVATGTMEAMAIVGYVNKGELNSGERWPYVCEFVSARCDLLGA